MTRVKLLIPWAGRLPGWLPYFANRMVAFRPWLDWTIVDPSVFVRRIVAMDPDIGKPILRMPDPRKLCEWRPLLGEAFADILPEGGWWGWCDLDCVFGDLRSYLSEERLAAWDVITDHPKLVNGPFAIFRNCPAVNRLWRDYPWRMQLLTQPEYGKFDEEGFTKLVRDEVDRGRLKALHLAGVHFHDRSPVRPVGIKDGKLWVETNGETRSEAMTYHFTREKRWPLA